MASLANSLPGEPPFLPTLERDESPYAFENGKRPSALQEAVNRSESAGGGETQNCPRARILKGVEEQHQANGHEAEQRQPINHARTKASPAGDGDSLTGNEASVTLPHQAIRLGLPTYRLAALHACRPSPSALPEPGRRSADNHADDQRAEQVGVERQLNGERRMVWPEWIEDQIYRMAIGEGDSNEQDAQRKSYEQRKNTPKHAKTSRVRAGPREIMGCCR